MNSAFAPVFRIEVNGQRLQADVSANVQQLTVTNKPDTLDSFSVVIVNEYPTMRWTHDKTLMHLFDVGGEVKIKLGYVDAMDFEFLGHITQISHDFPESGSPTLSVEGQSALHRLKGDKRTRTYRQVTEKDIVQRVAQDAHLRADVEGPATRHEYVIQANQTDYDFLSDRAARLDHEFLAQEKTLIFRPRRAPVTAYTFVWGPLQSPGARTLPLKNFSPKLNTSGQVTGVTARAWDHKTKSTLVAKATPPLGSSNQRTGPEIVQSAFGSREHVTVNQPARSRGELQERTDADLNRRAKKVVEGTASTIGVPDLRAGQKVAIEGVGEQFSGEYDVDEVRHTLGTGGYLTTFTVSRRYVK